MSAELTLNDPRKLGYLSIASCTWYVDCTHMLPAIEKSDQMHMLWWQASAAMHMSPLTTAEAVSAGLITGDRWRHDAMNFITHFPDAQQPSVLYNMALDPSAWRAACDSHTVGDFVAGAQARAEADGQLHNGVRAHVAPVHGKSSTSGSAGLIISVKILVSHTQSAPPSTA